MELRGIYLFGFVLTTREVNSYASLLFFVFNCLLLLFDRMNASKYLHEVWVSRKPKYDQGNSQPSPMFYTWTELDSYRQYQTRQ